MKYSCPFLSTGEKMAKIFIINVLVQSSNHGNFVIFCVLKKPLKYNLTKGRSAWNFVKSKSNIAELITQNAIYE